ncbi:MAG: transporter substrate-binding domain-containing protein [Anaerolineae bacterium]|jgi:polar amino acid transport system substrate-binding protein
MKIGQVVFIALVALLSVAICILTGVFVYDRWAGREATPGPEVGVTVPPPEVEDDSWARVRAVGEIVVGTSADYPPFEYYSRDLFIDGFDVALMDEIGRRLEVRVNYFDFAFDRLGRALELGQIDAAIAALSVTPERESRMLFSDVYFVGQDAVLARVDSSIRIGAPADLGPYRIGVQRATVFETWLQRELIGSGQMPAGNLFVYEQVQHAIRDLQEQRLDLVLLDAQPAEVAARAGGLKIVGRGMNQMRLAIAFPREAAALKAEVDRVLGELNNEGYIAQLATRYLDQDRGQFPPTPTPVPLATHTPAPLPGCTDGLVLIEHLNYDDQNMTAPPDFAPAQPFTKQWRVRNTGTCTWDTSYRLVYATGNKPEARMSGTPVQLTIPVRPGETYDLVQNLVSPLTAGVYQGFWQMQNGMGQSFGERLPVGIRVVSSATVTPGPTRTPVPEIFFSVDRTAIRRGECVTFSWTTQNVKEVYFYAEGAYWPDHRVPTRGQQQECPAATTTYYLRVVHQNHAVQVRQLRIYVEPAANAPKIERFTADPPGQITLGQCVTLAWEVTGQVDAISLTANGSMLWSNAPNVSTYQHCPVAAGTVAYRLEAMGPGGTSYGQQNILVVQPATATPEPTTAPDAPVIYSFAVVPGQIETGSCVDINWSTGGGTSLVRLLRNGVEIVADAGLVGQDQDCPSPAGSYTYRLEAENAASELASQERVVTVTDASPENPLADTYWQATAYWDGIQMQPVLTETLLTANFDAEGGLSGSGGCNTYSASYQVEGNLLTIGSISTTLMACAEPVMKQETAFLDALAMAARFALEGNQLYIRNPAQQVVLEFVAAGP